MGTRFTKMNIFQIMDYLTSIEKQYEVQDWTINDIHVWPFLKNYIRLALYAFYTDNYSFPSSKRNPLRTTKTILDACLSFSHSRLLKRQKNYDALIVDNGDTYDKLDGKWYGKFSDLLNEKLKENGQTLLTLSKSKSFLINRHTPYYHIMLPLWIALIKYKLFKKPLTVNMDQLDLVQNDLIKNFPDITWNLLSAAKNDAIKTELAADYFKKLLKKFNPKQCYMVTYYNAYNAGLCKACWDLSIPATDIQHGAQGSMHSAYAQWNNVPERGYNTLPRHFACWQQTDVDVIQKWADDTPHSAYVLGNLYLEKLASQQTPAHKTFNDFHKKQAANKQSYLITLQVGARLNQSIKDILTNNDDLFFWIRMHPTNIKNMPSTIEELKNLGVENYNIVEATQTPLYIILPHMDAHITLNSSVVIEAAYFNIPSIILDETGELYYQDYIKSGQALYEASPQDAIDTLKQRG